MMRARAALVAAVALGALAAAFGVATDARESAPPRTATLEALFTPGDAIDVRIAALIDGAKREVVVQAFSFTSRRIAKALVAAQRRGVQVTLIADRAQTLELAGSAVPGLARDGVPVWLDGNFIAAHNKVIVIDADDPAAATVITGSYNFTAAAQYRNAENVLIVRRDAPLAQQYRANAIALRERAERYAPAPR